MKKLKIILALMLAVPAFGAAHAADLGGGYIGDPEIVSQDLKKDAILAILTLSNGKTIENVGTDKIPNSPNEPAMVPNLSYDHMKLNHGLKLIRLGIQRDTVNFIFNNQFELGGELNNVQKSLGKAMGHYKAGNDKPLKQWVNSFVTVKWYLGFPEEGKLDFDKLSDITVEEITDELDKLPTPPAPAPAPVEDDDSSESSADDEKREDLIEKQEDYEGALESLSYKTENYNSKLDKALKRFKKRGKTKYERRIKRYQRKLKGISKAVLKYQGKLAAVNAELAELDD